MNPIKILFCFSSSSSALGDCHIYKVSQQAIASKALELIQLKEMEESSKQGDSVIGHKDMQK